MLIGDKMKINVSKDGREWGYNPAPDGTIVEVVGFGEIHYGRNCGFHKGGVYINDSWPNVKLPTGEIISISSCYLDTLGKKKQKYLTEDEKYLRPLPELPFYEGDAVRVDYPVNTRSQHRLGDDVYVINHISYEWMGQKRDNGTDMPIYNISDERGGWYMCFKDSKLTLVERGNFWKYYHGEKPVFGSLQEEANFFKALNEYQEIRNPANNLYKWELSEVLDALKDGIAHGFYASGNPFGGNSIHHSVIRFNDEELGKRVAAETLKGFAA